jgi:hypothetical protein
MDMLLLGFVENRLQRLLQQIELSAHGTLGDGLLLQQVHESSRIRHFAVGLLTVEIIDLLADLIELLVHVTQILQYRIARHDAHLLMWMTGDLQNLGGEKRLSGSEYLRKA